MIFNNDARNKVEEFPRDNLVGLYFWLSLLKITEQFVHLRMIDEIKYCLMCKFYCKVSLLSDDPS